MITHHFIFSQLGAIYCISKDGVDNDELQKALDYACGFGADCGPIQPNGPCFEPNTVKDHCNYAFNSYYLNMQSVGGTCHFAGAATTTPTPPTNIPSGCVYPTSSSDSGVGTTPPSFDIPTPPSTDTNPGTIFGTNASKLRNGSSSIKGTKAMLLMLIVVVMSWLTLGPK
ncbi:putative X8 domain-containing protein [Lupinus albus]|uniref:Putative X8 domain-containing protein n=1 Tax=Lupinus albus TaxID=3870 RepID=A0A6A4P6F7_LUPAL|nr:putative X8 domain-containing protein [Lupinus albus]